MSIGAHEHVVRLVLEHGAEQVPDAELRPEGAQETHARALALPHEEVAEARLARRADHQVDLGGVAHVHAAVDELLGDVPVGVGGGLCQWDSGSQDYLSSIRRCFTPQRIALSEWRISSWLV